MASDSTGDLIRLCASILDDGEVTPDEAYQLADWLNKHPKESEQWPGRELIQPLQEIWADGSVSKRELHRLARLLISVQREWAKRPQTEITTITGDPIPEFSDTRVNDVRLPSLSGKFRVPSQSESGIFYEVDLSGPSCTCPDWRTRRSRLPPGDLTRCCKHVLHVYATLPRQAGGDGWLRAFIENGWPASPGAKWHLLTVGSGKVLFCTASDKGWANVFAKEGREYLRFGYNVDERRWAYGSEPDGAGAIADAIIAGKTNGAVLAHAVGSNHRVRSMVLLGTFLVMMISLFVIGRRFKGVADSQKQSQRDSAPVFDDNTPKPTPVIFVSPPVRSSPSLSLSASSPPRISSPWSARTIRVVRAKADNRDVLIPKNARLRVIGRSTEDVMASYNGLIVTIPVSATDLK